METHIVDVFALDGNLGEEVELGELDSVLLDCFGAISRPNLAKDFRILRLMTKAECSRFGPGRVLLANRGW